VLVSIVIPTHNRAELLSELLSSIRDQSHRPVEVVVVDDASTDHTDQVIECFAKEICGDTGIVVTGSIMRKNGAQAARNKGIRLARGEALMFVDSDDILAERGLADLVSALAKRPRVQFAYGKVQVSGMDIASDPLGENIGRAFGNTANDLIDCHWHTMGALYRRECVKEIGMWNESLMCSQDWEYQVRAKLFGGPHCFVDTLVGYWRQHTHERIGGKEFRDDYAESTEPLFLSIHENAKRAGRNSKALERLLAKRLVRHAIYCGANGRRQFKRRILSLASFINGDDLLMRFAGWCLGATPSCLDRVAYSLLSHVKPVQMSKTVFVQPK
jgi:glycosyltransferase involved in cell wall biosynthesis